MRKITIKKNLLHKSEKLFIFLGLLGLFPFFIGLLDLLINKNNLFFVVHLPKYYGSIILTFLGAIYWGSILNLVRKSLVTEQIKFYFIIWSVIPSILAIIILTMKTNFSLLLLSMGFLLCQLVDEICYKFLLFPSWYLTLRRTLTLFVVLILIYSYFIMQTP